MEAAKDYSILVVEDDKETGEVIGDILKQQDRDVTLARSGDQALSLLKEQYFPIILSDTELGQQDGLVLLEHTKQLKGPSVIIYFTSHASVETAVKTLQEGAFDYINKPSDVHAIQDSLKLVIDRAIQHLKSLQDKIDAPAFCKIQKPKRIIGNSAEMAAIYKMVAKAALSDSNVLVTGESGTGKELIARAIHDNSSRAEQPFIVVNCSALAESLLESELFGHVKGAFTGAVTNKIGLFQLANHGTIFLDEIGDISPAVQVSILRTIQEGEVKPVGGTETQKVDVRVIAATHRDLPERIEEGKFRDDLYYRLKVIHIDAPPLRQRRGDIPELAEYFLTRSARRTGKEIHNISPEALEFLLAYPWPGNVRELENAIELAVTMSNTSTLYPEDFPTEVIHFSAPIVTEPAAEDLENTDKVVSLEELERAQIIKALEETGFNKAKTAELLGIDRVTLYRKAKKFGIAIRKTLQHP